MSSACMGATWLVRAQQQSILAASAGGLGSSTRAGRALPGVACLARIGAAAALQGACAALAACGIAICTCACSGCRVLHAPVRKPH
jgi:hypothetical protein